MDAAERLPRIGPLAGGGGRRLSAGLAHPVFDRYRRVTEMPRNQRTYL